MNTKYDTQLENILNDIRGLTEISEQDSLARLTKKIKEDIQAVPKKMKTWEMIPPKFVESLVNTYAYNFSQARNIKILLERQSKDDALLESSTEDMLNDYLDGRAMVCLMVLEDEMPFIRLDPESYNHLEGAWLRRVKQMKAYYIWKNHKRIGSALDDFFKAGQEIRNWLLHRPRSKLIHFDRIRGYIQREYLADNGMLDETKPGAFNLIKTKAHRIWQTTNQPDPKLNWYRAKLYVTMYYENIVGAVLENDERKTATILKAFEFSKSEENGYLIINAFEAVIAIDFLNKEIIHKLLNQPYSFDYNYVPADSWPQELTEERICEGRLSYNKNKNQLIYKGEMSEEERDCILSHLSDMEQRMSLEHLFAQSRRKPLEKMIL